MRARYIWLVVLLVWGCAHRNNVPEGSGDDVADQSQSEEDESLVVKVKDVESFRVSDPEPPPVASSELEVIPVEINDKVQQWVNYFQGRRGRPHMERYLSRMTRYSDLMKRILRRNGLPEDLIFIALIESGFSSKATSRAAAVGYWQFIRGTGKRYGLEINTLVDERRDPVLSTQAAAEYYKGLYSVFGSWYLAMAAYNVGENRVKREVMRNYTRDFWELARKRRLPKETIHYVPKFIAAKMIAKNPEKYGFTNIEYEKPLEFELIRYDKPVNLKTMAEKMSMEYDEFKQLNPKFRGEIAPTKENGVLELKVPLGSSQLALNAAQASTVDKAVYIADTGETDIYRVRRGDSLYTIARKYRTNVGWIKDVNDLKPGRQLKVGQRLIVPVPGSSRKAVAQAKKTKPPEVAVAENKQAAENIATSNPEVVKNGVVYYIVQPGDTLSEIAEEYDSTIKELRKMNKLTKKNLVLRAGMRLKVPKDEGLPEEPTDKAAKSDSKDDEKENAEKDGSSSDEEEKGSRADSTNYRSPALKGRKLSQNKQHQIVVGKKVTMASLKRSPAKHEVKSKFHVVKKGENLNMIAQKYQVPLSILRAKNLSIRGSHLVVGARIFIPTVAVR